jgi:hypothetical protein
MLEATDLPNDVTMEVMRTIDDMYLSITHQFIRVHQLFVIFKEKDLIARLKKKVSALNEHNFGSESVFTIWEKKLFHSL